MLCARISAADEHASNHEEYGGAQEVYVLRHVGLTYSSW
jgi:hypothetical protein